MSAYAQLSTTRALGYGVIGPIPVDAIWGWCSRHGLDPETEEHFTSIIMLIDAETLRRQRASKGK